VEAVGKVPESLLGVAFGGDLDAAVSAIPNFAPDVVIPGSLLREIPKSHPLDSSPDDDP